MRALCNLLITCLCCLALNSFSQGFDANTVIKINQSRDTKWDQFNLGLSQSADYVAVATPLTLLTAGLISKNSDLKKEGLNGSIAVLGTYGVGYLMKNGIKRERPFHTLNEISPVQTKDGYSMPSGSAAVAFTAATTLTSAYPKWYVAVPAYTYASAVAYARVRSGEHYPSDALVGAVIGAGSVIVTNQLMKWINKN
ncbi:phosphatase PAP2 family protein [Jiulongibacter sp. NS-SX5]|uniref:phosphatase PAP2 family protein n=1 Tax=Jiulongibacter sp. NS-SX5 TaxID=3463854 RepID=UPI0040598124